MNGIILCEESQAVTIEFRKKGHDFFSCDIQQQSGGYPEWHFKDDIFHVLSRYDNIKWQFAGSHPTCTFLTNSGVCWLFNKDGSKNIQRWIELENSINFFNAVKAKIKEIGKGYIENPIPHKYARDGFFSVISGQWIEGIGKYDQLIQPYQFGHLERKATCLWLYNLPKLEETNNVFEQMIKLPKNKQQKIHYLPPSTDRAKLRSKTYEGIARAMAEQWG